MKVSSKQNEISQSYLKNKNSNLAVREKGVLRDASHKTDFKPEKLYYRSSWWTSKEFGAFTYQGTWKNKKALIKIQGVKPNVSEIYMIKKFAKNNRSKIIRPPHLYDYIEWTDEQKYEALILEDVGHERMVSSPTNLNEVKAFYKIFNEYKKNCINDPWVEKPKANLSETTINSFKSWKEISHDLYPNHPLRENGDTELIERAVNVLSENFNDLEPEFMHGHFSAGDLIKMDNQIILRSNLYWSWRNPFRDVVFAYHWFMLDLHKTEDISEQHINEQRQLWMSEIKKIPNNEKEEELLKLALLERSTASLNLDALSINPQKEISKYIVEQTRKEVIKLINELN